MLWALGQPVAFLGLLLSFVVGLLLRRFIHYLFLASWRMPRGRIRPPFFQLQRDVDPYGVIGALIGGVGWGKAANEQVRTKAAALWLGPLAIILAAQAVFFTYALLGLDTGIWNWLKPSDILRGVPGPLGQQFISGLAVGLLAMGLVALIPLPPLDGWALLAGAIRRPSIGFQKTTYWLADHNIGVAILLAALLLPWFYGLPLLLYVLDAVASPLLRLWS